MNTCNNCKVKFIGWGWVIFNRATQDSTGVSYCSEECGSVALEVAA